MDQLRGTLADDARHRRRPEPRKPARLERGALDRQLGDLSRISEWSPMTDRELADADELAAHAGVEVVGGSFCIVRNPETGKREAVFAYRFAPKDGRMS